ncbi:hypothetical protein H4R24_003579 [Coemansia sp. RSA 988]|nr:hypothetical protein H4R24_003579 [Coemansia sp. RSA 988]
MEPPVAQSLSQPYGPIKASYPKNPNVSPVIGPQEDSDSTIQVPLVENIGFKPQSKYQQTSQPQNQQQILLAHMQQQSQQLPPQGSQQQQMPQAHMHVSAGNANYGVQGILQPNPQPSYTNTTVANDAPSDPYRHNLNSGTFPPPTQNYGEYGNPTSTSPFGVNYVNTYPNVPPQATYSQAQQATLANSKPYAAFDHSNPFQANISKPEHNAAADHHSSVSSTEPSGPPNTFRNRIKDFLGNVSVCETVPMASLITAALFHHYKHRNTAKLVPFQGPKWLRYLGNAVYARATYGFLTGNGLMKPRGKASQDGTRALTWDGQDSSYPPQAHGLPSSHTIGGYPSGMQPPPNAGATGSGYAGGVTQMVGKIVSGLFRSRNGMPETTSRGLNDNSDALDGFDESWAVPKHLAKEYYHSIYHKSASLYGAESYVIGGAAAISALHSEKSMARHHGHPNAASQLDYKHDYMVMGLALSEVETLLERKSEMGPLSPSDDLESIGKIALATLIKIKADEDSGGYEEQYNRSRTPHTMVPTHSYNEHKDYYHVYDGQYTDIDYEQRKIQHRPHSYHHTHSHHQSFYQDPSYNNYSYR